MTSFSPGSPDPIVEPLLSGAPAPDAPATELHAEFEAWLVRLQEHPAVHARFVNTLSMLEHIGSVKIARTQAGPRITEDILQHLAEETRHAQVLKRIARGIGAADIADYDDTRLLAGAPARGYFARLDVAVRAAVRSELPAGLRSPAAYLLVTLLVELRASWLYPAYQRALKAAGSRFSVRSIIGEEERHLADIREGMSALGLAEEGWIGELIAFEGRLFERLARRVMEEGGLAIDEGKRGIFD